MAHNRYKKLSAILILVLSLAFYAVPESTHAQYVDFVNAAKEYGLDTFAWVAAQKAVEKITSQTVKWINSGFEGNPAFITDPGGFFLNVGDQTASQFLSSDPRISQICAPFKANIRLALVRSYLSETGDGNYSCTLGDVANNFEGFLNDFSQGGWDSWFNVTQNNGSNPYGAYLDAKTEFNKSIDSQVKKYTDQLNWGNGFLSFEKCYGTETPDPTTGKKVCSEKKKTVTPGSVIKEQLNTQLGEGVNKIVAADEIDEIIGALLSQLVNRALGGGDNKGGLRSLSEPGSGINGGTFTGDLEDDDSILAPRIFIHGTNPTYMRVGDATVDLGADAYDIKDGDLTSQIVTTGQVDIDTEGTYSLTYTVTNSQGKSATVTRSVHVTHTGPIPVEGSDGPPVNTTACNPATDPNCPTTGGGSGTGPGTGTGTTPTCSTLNPCTGGVAVTTTTCTSANPCTGGLSTTTCTSSSPCTTGTSSGGGPGGGGGAACTSSSPCTTGTSTTTCTASNPCTGGQVTVTCSTSNPCTTGTSLPTITFCTPTSPCTAGIAGLKCTPADPCTQGVITPSGSARTITCSTFFPCTTGIAAIMCSDTNPCTVGGLNASFDPTMGTLGGSMCGTANTIFPSGTESADSHISQLNACSDGYVPPFYVLKYSADDILAGGQVETGTYTSLAFAPSGTYLSWSCPNPATAYDRCFETNPILPGYDQCGALPGTNQGGLCGTANQVFLPGTKAGDPGTTGLTRCLAGTSASSFTLNGNPFNPNTQTFTLAPNTKLAWSCSNGSVTSQCIEQVPPGAAGSTVGSCTGPTTPLVITNIVSTKFSLGDSILVGTDVNVRASPSVVGTFIGLEQAFSLGSVVGGPVRADNYNWWEINYDNGLSGWSIENNLLKN